MLDWAKLVERFGGGSSAHKIKFGRGVVGKLAGIAVAALVAFAYMARYLTPEKAFIAFLVTAAVTLVVVFSILLIAFKQPELALLEGTELIHYKQLLMLGTKDYQPDRELPPIPDPSLDKDEEEPQ